MRAHLNAELNRLMAMLQSIMADVLRNMDEAVRAVESGDAELAARVKSQDREIDEAEVRIEEECLKILALHQPVADDLRLVFQIAKANKDLERIGDLAAKIAEAAVPEPGTSIAIPAELSALLDRSRRLVQKSMAAFASRDAVAAREVWEADAEVDQLRDSLNRRIAEDLQREPKSVTRLLHLRDAVAALERMADHGVGIAKDVIYLIEGRIVRHQGSQAQNPPAVSSAGAASLRPSGQKERILFICVHNSARSQMAAAWLNHLHGDRFAAESAGLSPGTLNPLAVAVMKESGIDISRNATRDVFTLVREGRLYAYVITVCDDVHAERCPIFMGITRRLRWSFADPAAFTGTEEEKLAKTREVRDAIRAQIDSWSADLRIHEVRL